VPPKIRELISQLERAGFVNRGVAKPVTISGKPGDDAKQYQVRAVQLALGEVKE
jgi:hypothetical protein